MMCPAMANIKEEAMEMANDKTGVLNPALRGKFGKTWWNRLKKQNSAFVPRLAQNLES